MSWSVVPRVPPRKAKKRKRPVRDGWSVVSNGPPPRRPSVYVVPKPGNAPYSGMTDAQIAAQAQKDADAEMARRQAAIERTRQAAKAAAERDQRALQRFGEASARVMAPIPGQVTAIRNEAGAAIAGYGEGYSKEAQAAIEQGQGATAAEVAAQGQPGAPGEVDPAAVQRALYAQQGEIPATEQSQIGAASGAAAAGAPAVVMAATHEDIQQRMAEAASEDAGYRAQLLDLEAERPGLVSDALDKLYAIEEKKYGHYAAEQQRKLDQRELALRERAQRDLERQAGIKNKQASKRLSQQQQSLNLRDSKQKQDLINATKRGQQIDAAGSKVIGYVVDKDRNYVLDSKGRRIAVKQNPKAKRDQAAKVRAAATDEAATMRGKPLEAPKLVTKPGGALGAPAGAYKGRPGAKGLFPDGTTNDPARAQRDTEWTFGQAQSYLMQKYGLNRARARAILVSAGWRPGG